MLPPPLGSSLLPPNHASAPAELADAAALREAERGERLVSWVRAGLASVTFTLLGLSLGIPALRGLDVRGQGWVPLLFFPTVVVSWAWILMLRRVRYRVAIGRISGTIDVLLVVLFTALEIEIRHSPAAEATMLASTPTYLALMFMIAASGVRQDPVACVVSGGLAISSVALLVLRARVLVSSATLPSALQIYAAGTPWIGRAIIAAFATAMVALAARNARRMARATGIAVAEQHKITQLFGRYVDPEIARDVMSREGETAETRDVTVLFTDLRDFTTLSETLPPSDVLEALNAHYAAIVPVVHRHGGTVNKFIGDAIMATFGAPLRQQDHATLAVAAARDMLVAMDELNESRRRSGRAEFRMGVGIATGAVVVGTLGTQDRVEYAVIGDTVNTASRLEGLCKQFGVTSVVAASTRDRVGEGQSLRALGEATVKGKAQPLQVYTLAA